VIKIAKLKLSFAKHLTNPWAQATTQQKLKPKNNEKAEEDRKKGICYGLRSNAFFVIYRFGFIWGTTQN